MGVTDQVMTDPFPEEPAEGPLPTRSYFICSTPRSGSWLLVDLLRATGQAGVAREYFRLSPAGHLPDGPVQELLDQVRRLGTSENGVFSAKVHWMQFEELGRALGGGIVPTPEELARLLGDWFPSPRFVFLRRSDTDRQAVSWYRAIETNEWWQTGTRGRKAKAAAIEPDLARIAELEALLRDYEDRWAAHFKALDAEVLELDYATVCEDPSGTVGRVLDFLDLGPWDAPVDLEPRLKKQADDLSADWLARYQAFRAQEPGPQPTGAGVGEQSTGPPVGPQQRRPPVDLGKILANRAWIRSSHPFSHIRATDVFTPDYAGRLATGFREILDRGFGSNTGKVFSRGIPGYDAYGYNFSPDNYGPFRVFVSRPWLDMVSTLFSLPLTGHILCGLHHHTVGSGDGFLHHDLNPGFFADYPDPDGIVVARQNLCTYIDGTVHRPDVDVAETVRGVALIYYLDNPPWVPGDGGETGLYAGPYDNVKQPVIAVAPISNSMVLFECSPASYHSFISNRRSPRSSVIAWYHRPKEVVVAQWGEDQIRPHRGVEAKAETPAEETSPSDQR